MAIETTERAGISDEPSTARQRLDLIHDEIRMRICLLDYTPGMKLSETALAEEFGMSRTPLRRVLGRLEDEGLLVSLHGVGTLVTDIDAGELAQVYRLRQELVLLQVSLDPVPPSQSFVDRVRDILARAEKMKAAPSARDFSILDRDMFLLLLELTGNQPLRDTAQRLYFRTARIWLQQVTASQIDLMQEIWIYAREIKDILTALEFGDLETVGHLRRSHIALSFARMTK